MAKTHVARVRVSRDAILKWLKFDGGTIHRVIEDSEYWSSGRIELVIEHPDLPEVNEGDMIPTVVPSYRADPNGVLERVYPPVKSSK